MNTSQTSPMEIISYEKSGNFIKVEFKGRFDDHALDLYMAEKHPFELYRIRLRDRKSLLLKLLNQ
jgi:hypothetical protein